MRKIITSILIVLLAATMCSAQIETSSRMFSKRSDIAGMISDSLNALGRLARLDAADSLFMQSSEIDSDVELYYGVGLNFYRYYKDTAVRFKYVSGFMVETDIWSEPTITNIGCEYSSYVSNLTHHGCGIAYNKVYGYSSTYSMVSASNPQNVIYLYNAVGTTIGGKASKFYSYYSNTQDMADSTFGLYIAGGSALNYIEGNIKVGSITTGNADITGGNVDPDTLILNEDGAPWKTGQLTYSSSSLKLYDGSIYTFPNTTFLANNYLPKVGTVTDSLSVGSGGIWVRNMYQSGNDLGIIFYNSALSRIDTVFAKQP